jgi:hypothetical protein
MIMTRNQIIGAASSVFLLPSFVLTVIPTFAHDPGSAVCMTLGVVGLPFVPFALRRCDPVNRPILIVLGALLLLYNFSNALDALNGSHAMATGLTRNRMTAAAALNEKINELNVRKGLVDAHKIVSRESAEAAQRSRDRECGTGPGPLCRKLDDGLVVIERDRGLTERAENIERDLDKARADLADLGAVEKTADPTATQLAGIAGLFWSPAAGSGEAISTNRPIFKAMIVEMMGGLMPWVLVTIFGTAVATKAKAKLKIKKNAAPPSKDSVLGWFDKRIVRREGRSVRAGVAFEDYQTWCADNGMTPVSLRVFGEVLRDELGVNRKGGEKRTAYVGLELRRDFKVVEEAPAEPLKTPASRPGRMGKRGTAATA